ncbi:5-carboxymethyl-2-hydroxymuconate delta isomerase, putative [Vibrio mediterranei AK1]|nr:5-carboxymethyl-2-hydroxymuconate delta isomerase, putative [Vibrio mediterranei AK1]
MPNLVLEYSNTADERLNVQGLLEDLHRVTLNCGLFEKDSVKSRSLRSHNWLIGEYGDSEDFVHISFELLSVALRAEKRAFEKVNGSTSRAGGTYQELDGQCS